MSGLIGNIELYPFSTSEVLWHKDDLNHLGNDALVSHIVRPLKVVHWALESAQFNTLQEHLNVTDLQLEYVATLTGSSVLSRLVIGVAQFPSNGFSAFRKYTLGNPYLSENLALVAQVEVVKEIKPLPEMVKKRLLNGSQQYRDEGNVELEYYWAELPPSRFMYPSAQILEQFTYGTTSTLTDPQLLLTDIDPVLISNNLAN